MKKIILIAGSIISFLGILLSFYLPEMAWYNIAWNTETQWFNAMGGVNEQQIPDPIVILTFLPGIISLTGAILALIAGKNKNMAYAGAFLIFVGISLFIFNLMGHTGVSGDPFSWSVWAETLTGQGQNPLWGSFEDGSTVLKYQLGYGLILTGVGGIVVIVGIIIGDK